MYIPNIAERQVQWQEKLLSQHYQQLTTRQRAKKRKANMFVSADLGWWVGLPQLSLFFVTNSDTQHQGTWRLCLKKLGIQKLLLKRT